MKEVLATHPKHRQHCHQRPFRPSHDQTSARFIYDLAVDACRHPITQNVIARLKQSIDVADLGVVRPFATFFLSCPMACFGQASAAERVGLVCTPVMGVKRCPHQRSRHSMSMTYFHIGNERHEHTRLFNTPFLSSRIPNAQRMTKDNVDPSQMTSPHRGRHPTGWPLDERPCIPTQTKAAG